MLVPYETRGGSKMERLGFGPEVAFAPPEKLLEDVTVAPLSRAISRGATVQAAVFRIAAGGRIARHPATVPQILAVLDGAGTVSGADGAEEPIAAGEAVFWAAGEEHETRTDLGLTALVVEGNGIAPFRPRE
jgi:quercetin dioxygenase-like cupin family protein